MPRDTFDFIETELSKGVVTIILNDPQTLNAMTTEMMKEVIEALDHFEKMDAVRVVILTGKGRAFSAGAKRAFLEKLPGYTEEEIKETIYRYFAGGVKKIRNFPKPTIAAMRGAATGAGLELALACDFRIATKDAVLAETWIHLGLIDPLGGMSLLPRLVGLAKANELLLLGDKITGEEAQDIGLVNRAVEEDKLDQTVGDYTSRLAASAPLALKAMKDGIRRGLEQAPDSMADTNIRVQSQLAKTEDFKEGVRALFAKEKPAFSGR
ncbi:MAG: enoyl-CoA hydratase/isomerase family protein [Sneathiella sp.]